MTVANPEVRCAEHRLVPLHGSFIAPPFERATVGDAMHPGILTCNREASRAEIAWIMAAHRVHCVAVMALAQNGSGEPYVWGIVSDLDLLGSAVDPTLEPTARDLAGQPIISVERTAPLREAAGLMHEHRVKPPRGHGSGVTRRHPVELGHRPDPCRRRSGVGIQGHYEIESRQIS